MTGREVECGIIPTKLAKSGTPLGESFVKGGYYDYEHKYVDDVVGLAAPTCPRLRPAHPRDRVAC